MKEGEYPIEVKAAVKDSSLNDGIIKTLRVVVRETRFSDGPRLLHSRVCTRRSGRLTLAKNVGFNRSQIGFL